MFVGTQNRFASPTLHVLCDGLGLFSRDHLQGPAGMSRALEQMSAGGDAGFRSGRVLVVRARHSGLAGYVDEC